MAFVDPPGTGGQQEADYSGLSAEAAYLRVNESICCELCSKLSDRDRCYLLGHSFGGIHAVDCAWLLREEFGREVHGVILVASPFTPRLFGEILVGRLFKHGNDDFKACYKDYFAAPTRESLRKYAVAYGCSLFGASESVGENILRLMGSDPCSATAMAHFGKSFPSDADFITRLGNLPIRKLAILGEFDKLVPLNEALTECDLAGIKAKTVPDAGHFPFMDRPDLFQQILEQWLVEPPTIAE